MAALSLSVLAGTVQEARAADWIVDINDIGSDPIPVGGTIIYNITVANDDLPSSIAPANTLSFTIPASATFTGGTGTITNCTPVPGIGPTTIQCSVPALPGEGEATLQAQVLTSEIGTISVTASVPTSVQVGNVLVTDADPNNNRATQQTTVTTAADLQLSVTGPESAASGSVVSYIFTAENLGPDTAYDVTIDVPKPSGLDNIITPAGCILNGSNYTCVMPGSISFGGTATIEFTGQISAVSSSTLTVAATITDSGPGDPRPDNNTAIINTKVDEGSDVTIAKSRSPSGPLVVNDQVTFTLSPSYTGETPVGLTITDVVPTNYAIDSVTASAASGWICEVSGQEVTCRRSEGDQAGANVSLGQIVILATVIKEGDATNEATIAAEGPRDPDLTNNTATDGGATIGVESSDLRANKRGPSDPPLVVVGQSYPFRISTTNLGNRPFSGTIVMTDDLPAGLTVTSYDLNDWSCSPDPDVVGPQAIVCTREYTEADPLAVGATTPEVVLTARVTDAGRITNALTVTSKDERYPDPDLDNNTTSTQTGSTNDRDSADIQVIKRAGLEKLPSGEEQSFDIEIVNAGPSTATDVELTDDITGLIDNVVGSGLGQPVSSDPNLVCSLTPIGGTGGRSGRLFCEIAELRVCTPGVDCPRVSVVVRPGGNEGTRTNTARAISNEVGDPDLTNNRGRADYLILARADVTVEKSATPPDVKAGQPLTYIIAAETTDDGRSDAQDVTITDDLPAGLVFVSATPSSGICSDTPVPNTVTASGNDRVRCNLGTVPNGGQQTVTILVRPTTDLRGTSFSNKVSVTTSTEGDDPDNNTADVEVRIMDPTLDLQINKSDEPNVIAVDEVTVYTITTKNNGPSDAENVVIRDDLPVSGNLVYQSFTAPADATCAITPASGLPVTQLECSFPRLTAGASRVITVSMRGEIKGNVDNLVEVSSTETRLGFDTNMRNNRDAEQTTVRNRVDLKITKDTTTPTVELRQPFTFDITVENLTGTRLGEADDVRVLDTLPSGIVLTGTPVATASPGVTTQNTCTGTAGSSSFTCNFGTVARGGIITISVPVRATSVSQSPQNRTNTANVTTSSLDINAANDSDPAVVTITSTAVSGLVFRDFNANASQNSGDTGIAGISISLTGTASIDGATITRNATTNSSGAYAFNFLPAGTYTITRGAVSEANLTPGVSIPGTGGGTATSATIITGTAAAIGTPSTANNFTLIPQSSIVVTKDLQSIEINPDTTFYATFELTVSNPSLESITGISLTDQLAGTVPPRFGNYVPGAPGENEYTILAAPSGNCGGYNSSFNGSSDIVAASGFTLTKGASCDVFFTVHANPAVNSTVYTNTADVEGTGTDSEKTLEDTSNEVSLTAEFTASIELEKSVGTLPQTPTVKPGDPVKYTFTVTNTGDVRLTGISVTDPLVANIICPETTLDPGQSTVCTGDDYLLTAQDIIAGKVDNTAEAFGQPPKLSTVNDEDSSTTPLPQFALLAIDKTYTGYTDNDASGAISLGDTLSYTIIATNTGTLPQTNVVVSDDRITPSTTTCATLAPGAQCTLTGSLTVSEDDVAGGKVVNEATADSTEADEQTDGTTTPVPGTDMEVVSKTANPAAVPLGAEFSFTILLRNNAGEDPLNPGQALVDAAAVKLSDTLPTGMVLAGGPSAAVDQGSATLNACTGALGETSFTCDFGLVATGSEITVTVPVRVISISTSPETLTNEASVSTTTRDVKPENNINDGDVTVAAAGISGKVYRDFADDGAFDPTDTGLEGIEVTLTGTAEDGSSVTRSVVTNAAGEYSFTDLPVGVYTITRGSVPEPHLVDGRAIAGTAGGEAQGAVIVDQISIGDDQVAAGYDFTLVPQARIGMAKRVSGGPVANTDGTLDVSFELLITNLSLETMTGLAVEDVLQGENPLFGTYSSALDAPGTYAMLDAPTGTCGGLESSYNGASNATVASGFSLAPDESCTISISIAILPTDPPPTPLPDRTAYFNQASVSGTGELSGQQVDDLSDDGDNPDSNGNGIGNEDGENNPTPVKCPDNGRALTDPADQSTGTDGVGPRDEGAACPIINPPKLTLTKEMTGYDDLDNNGAVSPRDVLRYTITAENTGSIILENVVVTDDLITPNRAECPVLNTGETCVLEGTLTVTIDDAQQGEIVNTATANSRQTSQRRASVTVAVTPSSEGNSIIKQALVSSAKRGERVPYVIIAEDVPVDPATIIDIMPPGFSYLPGSASANGTAIEPAIDGRNLTFAGLVPDSGNDIRLELTLIVTSGASTGDSLNRAQLVDPDTGNVLGTAQARVTILKEAVFDCSDVIGKVFDDKNRNGYQDDGEPGLPGVRLATVKGLLVTTDPHGRFSIGCADIPDEDIGSNFIVKLDTRTLPTGYRVTTENPRKVRLTRGKVVKLNFGASITRLVALDLNAKVFEDGSNALKPKWEAGLSELIVALGTEPSTLRISYTGADAKLAKTRLKAIAREIERRWKAEGRPYRLSIETRVLSPKGEASQ